MHKRTIIDKIEIEPQTGNVAVRMKKQLISDDGTIDDLGFHRTMIDAETDPAVQMAAVDAHLATMGLPAVSAAEKSILNAAVSAFSPTRAAKAAEQAAKGKR